MHFRDYPGMNYAFPWQEIAAFVINYVKKCLCLNWIDQTDPIDIRTLIAKDVFLQSLNS